MNQDHDSNELIQFLGLRDRIRIAADIWLLESGRLDLAVTQDGELIEVTR